MADPYRTLGLDPSASEAQLRAAYRRLALLHHPDHNGGSPEAARRFEGVQEAYAEIRLLRARASTAHATATDPDLEARLAAIEREVIAARERAERVRTPSSPRKRPSDEELGRFSTDDSFAKIIDDAAAELSERLRSRP